MKCFEQGSSLEKYDQCLIIHNQQSGAATAF